MVRKTLEQKGMCVFLHWTNSLVLAITSCTYTGLFRTIIWGIASHVLFFHECCPWFLKMLTVCVCVCMCVRVCVRTYVCVVSQWLVVDQQSAWLRSCSTRAAVGGNPAWHVLTQPSHSSQCLSSITRLWGCNLLCGRETDKYSIYYTSISERGVYLSIVKIRIASDSW